MKQKKIKKDQLAIVLLCGLLLLVITIPVGDDSKEDNDSSKDTSSSETYVQSDEYATYLETHLEEVLSELDGAGDVKVMITLASSTEKVVEKDQTTGTESVTESDSQGGTRNTQNSTFEQATVYNGSGESQSPYVQKELYPEVEGVIVLATGGDNAVIVENITAAVQALFGIDTHKIRIMKKEAQNK